MKLWSWMIYAGVAAGGLTACSSDSGGGDGGTGGDGASSNASTTNAASTAGPGSGGSGASSGAGATGSGATGSGATGSGATGSGATGSGGSGTGGGGECGQPDAEACYTCCETAYPAGAEAEWMAFESACLCGQSAPCATQCADSCGGGEFSQACDDCASAIAETDACIETYETACEADAGCTDFVGCIDTCPE